MQSIASADALRTACEKAADAAIAVLKAEGQPQFSPSDPEKFAIDLRWSLTMAMAQTISRMTGQGSEILLGGERA